MENDQPFEVDADLGALHQLNSQSRQRSSHKGQDALEAMSRRFGSHKESDDENTPLLGRDGELDVDIGENVDNGGDDGRAPASSGTQDDFEGRPWWNKPSVRQ